MGVVLAKEHSAADWSTRPLPQEWLTYAALDVELLVELRDAMHEILQSAGKLEWAEQEFAAILKAPPPPPRVDPWRRTSGMHKIKRRDHLTIIRELWIARDAIASNQDIASGKLLNDSAIIELALTAPKTKKELEKALRPLGLRARWLENSPTWLDAISRAVALPEDKWPAMRSNADTLPPIKLWRDKFPEKFAPLSHARALIEGLARANSIPMENLISPEIVRRICWSPPAQSTTIRDEPAVRLALAELGARPWQIDLIAPYVADALLEHEALEIVEPVDETTPESD
jgi:ribonuclease D